MFIAFSTAVPALVDDRQQWSTLKNDDLDPLLTATVQATEEAIINALIAAKTMSGINNNTFYALPHERLREVLKKYNRLLETLVFRPLFGVAFKMPSARREERISIDT